MRVDIHVHVHNDSDNALSAKMDLVLAALRNETQGEKLMFEDLSAKVQKVENAADAMDTVLQDVNSRLKVLQNSSTLNPTDKAALQAITDGLDKEGDKLVADTLANTPADPNAGGAVGDQSTNNPVT